MVSKVGSLAKFLDEKFYALPALSYLLCTQEDYAEIVFRNLARLPGTV
jgi:hypothetical protein